jgi:mRNA interferase YafQ
MKYDIRRTNEFKKNLKSLIKSKYDMSALEEIISLLSDGKTLPAKNRDHALSGNWIGYRECHIAPDWLLVYRIDNKQLILTLFRTGTHSNVF